MQLGDPKTNSTIIRKVLLDGNLILGNTRGDYSDTYSLKGKLEMKSLLVNSQSEQN